MAAGKSTWLVAGSILTIIASLTWIIHTQSTQSFADVKAHQAVGEVLAEETTKLLASSDTVLVLTSDSTRARFIKTQTDAFAKALHRTGRIHIVATEKIAGYDLSQKGAQ